jgi:hypothetical protein
MAIYKGQKEPSQGDMDITYATHVKELVMTKRLDQARAAAEEARLLKDLEGKLRFELEQVFPVGNKITFGRISAYCPVFGDHNVQRKLEPALVSADKLKKTMEEILELDFSAFYRTVMYSNPNVEINNMDINVEYLPNFILMPNVGSRGVMWQEIESRKRNTRSRMFLPIFFQEDLKTLLMRLTGEFRWEMCKRTQGGRWSDATYPSLTSEYFTYLQFYRGNKELSLNAKAAVKTELMRGRNVYRAVFVNNYIDWLMYESNASQRLNKVARKIMASYCPFPQALRDKLNSQNPQYAEALKVYEIDNKKEIQRLAGVIHKIEKMPGKKVPQELLDEMKFLEQ